MYTMDLVCDEQAKLEMSLSAKKARLMLAGAAYRAVMLRRDHGRTLLNEVKLRRVGILREVLGSSKLENLYGASFERAFDSLAGLSETGKGV